MSVKPSPSPGPTLTPGNDFEEIHGWSELLQFFNHTFSECHTELNENTKRVVLFILYLAIFVVGLVENILVICVNWRRSGRAGLLNLYMLNIAIADLGIILSLPVWMLEVMMDYTWLWGSFSCRFIHYFYLANMYSSIFFLTCLSIDRYVSLTNASPSWQQRQHRIRRAICACVWVFSAVVPIPGVIHIQLLDGAEPMCLFLAPFETYSTWSLAVALSDNILGFLLPFPLIAIFNLLTASRLRRQARPESRRHCLWMWVYIAVFAVCWLPYHVTMLLLTLQGTHILLHCRLVNLLYFFYEIIDCFAMLHCVLNPILYNFLSPSFRGRLRSIVVRYLPKDQAGAAEGRGSSLSSTQHSIIITKEGSPPDADLHPHSTSQASSPPPPNSASTLGSPIAS